MKKILTGCLFLSLISFCQAQQRIINTNGSTSFPQEKTHLEVNAEVLLVGENLLFQIRALNPANNTQSMLSKVAYVALKNEKDSLITFQKLLVNNGVANGDFFIPAGAATGVYTLLAYTNYSKNNTQDAFSEKKLVVINPYIVPSKKEITDSTTVNFVKVKSKPASTITPTLANNSDIIELQMVKSTFGPRERATLTIKNRSNADVKTPYMLSIRKVAPVTIEGAFDASKGVNFKKEIYLPELRGELISGKLETTVPGGSVADKVVSFSIPGENFIFKQSRTNDQGIFYFSVFENYTSAEAIVQVQEPDRENYTITVDAVEVPSIPKNELKTVLTLDPSLKDWLEKRSIQLQLENAYFNKKKDQVIENKFDAPFYDSLGTLYVLDEFKRFPSVRETFIEVVQLAGIRRDGDKNKIEVVDYFKNESTNAFSSTDPLLLMDGVLVQNVDDLLNYSASALKSVRVFPQPYRYGPKIYSGIVSVKTFEGDFTLDDTPTHLSKFEMPQPQLQKEYFMPVYDGSATLKRIPDNRVQLLWNPTLEIENTSKEVSFYTSDVTGTFEVVLKGYTPQGSFIREVRYFTVEESK